MLYQLVNTLSNGTSAFAMANLGSFSTSISGVNLNSTGDTISILNLPSRFIINQLVFSNWSATPSVLLVGTLRDAAAAGGNSLVGSIAGLNTPITSTALAAVATPLASVLGASRAVTTNAVYLNLTVANGTALSADMTLVITPLV